MSSFWGSVCLLVLLGVVVASGSPNHFVTENLTRTHDIVADALGLKKPEVSTKNLFTLVISSIKEEHQRKEVQLMNATLGVYDRILSSILQQQTLLNQVKPESNRPQVAHAVRELQRKMNEVRSKLRNPMHNREHQIEDVISMLNEIKVDDASNQKTALAEYKEVFQAASVIISKHGHARSAGRRRRRR